MWRDLRDGDEGNDVRQLETNLVRLGYDPGGEVIIDDEFTSATADMVELWEEDLGLEETGDVPMSRVTILPGPTEVVSTPVIGQSARRGDSIIAVDALVTSIDVVGWATDSETVGEIDSIAPVDAPVEHGTVLYTADAIDVVAVVEIDEATTAMLEAIQSGEVEAIESVLVYIGYDPDGLIDIDDETDLFTVAAVTRWQESVGLPPTGSADAGDYVIIPEAADAPYVVGDVYLEAGNVLGGGQVVMSLTTPTLAVTADVAIGEIDEFDVGDTVIVEQLDESTFDAVVASIADVANPSVSQDAAPTITVTFDVVSEPDEFVSGAVTIITESARIDDAMVVPTRALVTLREGGFAVEKELADGSVSLVGVDVGTFDDGLVEIVSVTTGELEVGDEIVVPS